MKLVATGAVPELSLASGHTWHYFLSHIWSTGQDQCATIKRQLCLLVPGFEIFLDVDDLKSIDALEEYVNQSAVFQLFCSKGYFKSGNCLREVEHAVKTSKKLALVHDPVKGGAPLDVIKNDECSDALRGPIFDGRTVIVWHRIKDFQRESLNDRAGSTRVPCASLEAAEADQALHSWRASAAEVATAARNVAVRVKTQSRSKGGGTRAA